MANGQKVRKTPKSGGRGPASSKVSASDEENVVAIWKTISFDHESALTLASRFVDRKQFFLLESAIASTGAGARYTFMGFDSIWNMEVKREEQSGPDPVTRIEEQMKKWRLLSLPVEPDPQSAHVPLMGGAVGFFTFDTITRIEPTVGTPPPALLKLPLAHYFVPANLFVLDHLSQRLTVVRYSLREQADGPKVVAVKLRGERARLDGLLAELVAVHRLKPLVPLRKVLDFDDFDSAVTQKQFDGMAKSCLDEIKKGEIFQIQIGNRLSRNTKTHPFDIYRRLRSLNPSPYMFYYHFDHHTILGASPEMMVGVQGDRVTHRPIAGTRRRRWEPVHDERMRQELKSSEKERAEHIMLVDLARNDIGRIAEPGTVKVEHLMGVEEYSHVFHMVSQVTGKKRQDVSAAQALVAGFPNGTVCGAPKIRAIQLIYGYEKMAREFYAGSLGLFDFSGNLRSTILIRTIYVGNGKAHTQASAGIVYDSIPAQEWLETRNKMAACATAMLQPSGA